MAELAERLPAGAEEVVLGRRVSAGGRTSAFVAGRAATAADLKLLGGRLLAFFGQHEHRKLTISSAQLEVLDGFAGAEHLELRERYREAHRECRRLAAELAELREARGLAGARPRPLPLRALRDRGGRARPPRSATRWRPSASACATPRACARRRRAPTPAWLGAEEDGGGAAAALAQAESLLQGAAGSTPASTRSPSGSRRWRSSSATSARSCATTPRGSRPTRGAAGDRGAAGSDRPARAQARRQRRVGARPRRALPGRDRPAGGRRGARRRGRGGAGRGRERRRELGERARARAAPRPPRRWKRGSPPSWSASRWPGATLEVVLEPHPDGFGAGGRETVELRVAPNPGSRRRRCATRPPAASSRG